MKATITTAPSIFSTKAWLSNTAFRIFALALLVVSPKLLLAIDFTGRYAIESATYKGKFLRGLPQQQTDVVTADGSQGTVFAVRGEKDGSYTLQTHIFFLSIEGGEHDVVMHKANGGREKFKIVENGDGTVSMMAMWNKKYVTVDQAGNAHSSVTNGADAKFKLYKK